MENAARTKQEEKEEQLQKDLRQADLKHVLSKLSHDLALLEAHTGTEQQRAVECAMDLKYLRDRQQSLSFCLVVFFEYLSRCVLRTL